METSTTANNSARAGPERSSEIFMSAPQSPTTLGPPGAPGDMNGVCMPPFRTDGQPGGYSESIFGKIGRNWFGGGTLTGPTPNPGENNSSPPAPKKMAEPHEYYAPLIDRSRAEIVETATVTVMAPPTTVTTTGGEPPFSSTQLSGGNGASGRSTGPGNSGSNGMAGSGSGNGGGPGGGGPSPPLPPQSSAGKSGARRKGVGWRGRPG